MEKVKKNKFSRKITRVDEIDFDSKMEAKYYVYLKQLKEEEKIKDFELQPNYKLLNAYIVVDGKIYEEDQPEYKKYKNSKKKTRDVRRTTYSADFRIIHNDNSETIVDVKGYQTDTFPYIRKMFDLKYKDKTLKLVEFYNGQWHDTDELAKAKSDRKRKRTYAKKEKDKKKINSLIKQLSEEKISKEDCINKIEELKNLTEREIKKTIEICIRDNDFPKDILDNEVAE